MSRLYSRIAAAALCLAVLADCGGGAGSSTAPPPPPLPTGSNVAALIVDAGPSQTRNQSALGQRNDLRSGHRQLPDQSTIYGRHGSTGLRIVASALNATPVLPLATTAAGEPMYECYPFADGDSWGSVRLADVQVANGKAGNLKVQLIGDPAAPAAPTGCTASQNTIDALGANGLLGIGVFVTDCGDGCNLPADPGAGLYFVCPAGTCVGSLTSPASQLLNPISQFAADNNGATIVLPAVPATGQLTASGALILGIDTQSNNQLGAAALLSVDPQNGSFTTVFAGTTYTDGGYIDSGSTGNFFTDAALARCTSNSPEWYCPASVVTLSATNQGVGASSGTSDVSFRVASLDALTNANPSFTAFGNIGGTNPISGFDWGLPFFFGRSVSIVFEGQTSGAGMGPLFAYADFN